VVVSKPLKSQTTSWLGRTDRLLCVLAVRRLLRLGSWFFETRVLGLVLHDDGARRRLIAMTHAADLEGAEVAALKHAVDA
jgi:hypothetical protein